MNKKMECILLHGWGVSNTVWQNFADQLKGFDKVSMPCLYEVANETEDNKLESAATILSKKINSNSIIVAWSIGGQVATQLASITNKVKAIVYIASPPCFINKDGWLNVMSKKNIEELQNRLSADTVRTLKYFSGLVAHGDVSVKNTNKILRNNLADEKYKTILSLWLKQMIETDQTKQFVDLTVPIQIILAENDSLINSNVESQIKELNVNVRSVVINNCGHAPFISKTEETIKIIDEFINAELN
jgi:pimeloyl-[acyl-carrier protein] methyl ester esterase